MPHLTLSKRFEFCAAHRLYNEDWSKEKNIEYYGAESFSPGHGHNYTLHTLFTGPMDPRTGMVKELSQVKTFVNKQLLDHVDHYFLNEFPEFKKIVPTTEAFCAYLFAKAQPLFTQNGLRLEACHLIEHPEKTVWYPENLYSPYQNEDHSHTFYLIASHSLYNPSLTPEENKDCFGKCTRFHGHNFTLTFTTLGPITPYLSRIEAILAPLQYRSLCESIPMPSCENVIDYFWKKSAEIMPLTMIKLCETPSNTFILRKS